MTSALLLAVDLGVRTGLAFFDSSGDLVAVQSRNLGRRSRLREAAKSLLKPYPDLCWVVAEGNEQLARAWFDAVPLAEHRLVVAETWRQDLFHPSQRRNATVAKKEAEKMASEIVRRSQVRLKSELTHDAAEAILIGVWAFSKWF